MIPAVVRGREVEMIQSYSSPFAVGHKALADFWTGGVVVEEKVDGSQFSFRREGDDILCRAHKMDLTMFTGEPEHAGMFKLAIETALSLRPMLNDGWTYRGEFLPKPKANTLEYDHVPRQYIILFDIDQGLEDYLWPEDAAKEADRLDLDFVPILGWHEARPTLDELKTWIEVDAFLGKQKVEGVVLKNYGLYGADKKTLMAKLVRRDFVEDNREDWKKRNPGRADVIVGLIERFATEARWRKAVQHLSEQGKLIGAPQDIGLLIHEIPADVFKDAEEEIKDALYAHFKGDISRGLTRGFPEWYKRTLAESLCAEPSEEKTDEPEV